VEPVGAAQVFRVDVRVIAATNKDLQREIRRGKFRDDLLFRLNVVPILCPPLRHFARRFCQENNFKPKTISDEALAALGRHGWPGNVRELRNVVERLLIMTPGDIVREVRLEPSAGPDAGAPTYQQVATLKEFKDAAEREFLVHKLEQYDWNISQTAKEIGTPRSNLYKKLEQYGLAKGAPDSDDD